MPPLQCPRAGHAHSCCPGTDRDRTTRAEASAAGPCRSHLRTVRWRSRRDDVPRMADASLARRYAARSCSSVMPSGSAGRQVPYVITARSDSSQLIGGTGLSVVNAVPGSHRLRAGTRLMGPGLCHGSVARHGRPRRAPRARACPRILSPAARSLPAGTREVRVRLRRHLATLRRVPEPLARWAGRCALLCHLPGGSAGGVRSTRSDPPRAD